ncbi:hypothetical protein MHU86_15670 [Fragilaria crotonensis]|nr:hypothetical protein MHU86_15670 [Fragilaria crotonensis]
MSSELVHSRTSERSFNSDFSRRKTPKHDSLSAEMTPHDGDLTEGRTVRSEVGEATKEKEGPLDACLHKICLHPKLSLKNQLLLSFGLVSTFSLAVLVLTAILTIQQAGDHVKVLSREDFEHATEEKLAVASRIIAESVTAYLEHATGLPSILVETTRDRFVGYPDHPGYADDSLVPFWGEFSGRNVYPLNASTLLPLDWQFQPIEVTDENADEHFLGRRDWYAGAFVGTGAYIGFQGTCNPEVTDPEARGYFPNCTDAHNDLSSGGAVQPTTTYELIHRKVSDFATAVLKPLYEAHPLVVGTGIYFANSGAGAFVSYPSISYEGQFSYTSEGCEWLLEPNPFDNSRTIGTEVMVDRCHPAGTEVATWFYNPLERAWCREQALDPTKVHFFGPYLDAFEPDSVLFSIGKAVYDRVTNEFIACTLADFSIEELSREIETFKITNSSEVYFVRWDDGTVIASSKWNATNSSSTTTLFEIDSDVDLALFTEMKQRFTISYQHDRDRSHLNPVHYANDDVFAMYPLPTPPKIYDPDYVPEFTMILSLKAADVYSEVSILDDHVGTAVRQLIQNVLIAGFVGLTVVILSIFLVSMYLTKPMEWMVDISDQIVQNLWSEENDVKIDQTSAWLRFSPRTEVSLLVEQFHKIVKQFSGRGTAKLHTHTGVELRNPFVLHEVFASLYAKRRDGSLPITYDNPVEPNDHANGTGTDKLAPIHWGPNFHPGDKASTRVSSHHGRDPLNGTRKIFASPLFRWILGTIAAPLLVVMIVISAYVCWNVSKQLPRLATAVKEVFVAHEQGSLHPLAKARADFSSRAIAPAFRDGHLLNRISGWLAFGALQKAQSMTSMETGTEECKGVKPNDMFACPYTMNRSNTPCDCKWKQRRSAGAMPCLNYSGDSRSFQKLWWFGSNQDAWPNGDVNFTSFPEVATTPANTSWWSEWNVVPGSELGFNATHSDTAFENLLFLSALSMIQIPLFNYQTATHYDATFSYTSFEDNGIMSGYTGCEYVYAYSSQFISDAVTGAAEVNSTLCPLGKFGYDPRCRMWYLGGKLTLAAGGTTYVSPPFRSLISDYIAQTLTLPIYNEDRFIGQNSVDFSPSRIIDSLSQSEPPLPGTGFHVLVSTSNFSFGSDAIVGPGFDVKSDLESGRKRLIEQSVLPFDVCENGVGTGCDNLAEFHKIVDDMRAGKSGTARFKRSTEEGGTEFVFWAFAPVNINSYQTLNNSDIFHGVVRKTSPAFSLALASPEPGLNGAFDSLSSAMLRTVQIAIIVLAIVIALTLVGLTVISGRVTASLIKPISGLLRVLTKINNHELRNDNEETNGGSTEVTKVNDAIERLHTVLPVANIAFFSGDLKTAYETLRSALDLFTKLRNEKAIGVANNNLGNTMLSMYRTMKATKTSDICGFSRSEVISLGAHYFKCAVDQGENALSNINEEEGWSTNYLVVMQQLSNRYFNRAVFYLNVKDDYPEKDKAQQLGFQDLITAKDMDREVVDDGDSHGFKGDRGVYFELLLGRIKGILQLIALGYPDEWGIEELFEDAQKELAAAFLDPGHALFRNIQAAGQMQRLDAALIEHYLLRKDNERAALVAIRMLFEDEFVSADAAIWALKGLAKYVLLMREEDLCGEDPSDIQSKLFQYRQRISEVLVSSSECVKTDGKRIMMKESAKQTKHGDVSMEFF